MAKEFSRFQRVEGQIQRELAALIRDEIKDPRVGLVTVSAVKVSRDLGHAKVYVTVLGDDTEEGRAATLKALNHAAGFLRKLLGQGLKMRAVPQLHFHYDHSIERGMELSALIDGAVRADRAKSGDDESSDE